MPNLSGARTVFRLPVPLYSEGAPVWICAGELLAREELCYVRITLQVIDKVRVRSVTVAIQAMDKFGAPLGLELPYRYRCKASRDQQFGAKEDVLLPVSDAGAFEVRVLRVDFEEGEEPWLCDLLWTPLEKQPTLEEHYGDHELAEQFRIRYGRDCRYRMTADADLWRCTCGAVNRDTEPSCHRCRRVREALKRVNTASLRSEKDRRVEREPLRAEATKEEKRAAVRKALIAAAIIVPLLILAIGLLIEVPKQMERKNLYEAGMRLAGSGEYEEALATFETLGDYLDSREMAEQGVAYLRAGELMLRAGQDDASALQSIGRTRSDLNEDTTAAMLLYEAAQKEYEALGDYKDSPEKAEACAAALVSEREALEQARLAEADALLAGGQFSAARVAYLALGAEDKAQEAVYRKVSALTSYIEHNNILGVYASLSMEPDGRSVFSMSKDKALALGSQSVADLLACCGEDLVDLQLEDAPPPGLLPLDEAVRALIGSIEGYRDTARLLDTITEATDYTRAFYTLCENGDLVGAYEWLQAYDGEFEYREEWLGGLQFYIPYCAEWELYLGDATVIPMTVGNGEKCMVFRSRVLLKDDRATLRLSDAGGTFSIDLYADLGSGRFTNEEVENVFYLCLINNYGRMAYFKYQNGGILASSCEYSRVE